MKPTTLALIIGYFFGFLSAWIGLGLLLIWRDIRNIRDGIDDTRRKMGDASCPKK